MDRLLDHAITVNIRSNSYRLKNKLKAALVKPAEVPAQAEGSGAMARKLGQSVR